MRRKAIPTFRPHARARERRESALALVRAIIPLDIEEPMKRKMLSHCLWYVTETEGTSKYKTRFMSRNAIGKPAKALHHEHVFPRKRLIDEMLAYPPRAVEIAATAVGCTVTREEHARLELHGKAEAGVNGWQRYRKADIDVIDTMAGKSIFSEDGLVLESGLLRE